ncbi:hypothetical protein JCM10213_003282 [Rhodosporidiobolus nylandii]
MYRQLAVHPGQERLGLPHLSAFVFSPFCLVSKTWYHLASPFLFRHLTAEHLFHADALLEKKGACHLVTSLDFGGIPIPSVGVDRWEAARTYPALPEGTWKSLGQRYAPSLRTLDFGWREDSAFRIREGLWEMEAAAKYLCAGISFPALRSLNLDLNTASLPRFVFDIVCSAPSLTDLILTATAESDFNDWALLLPNVRWPRLRLETLEMHNIAFDVDTLDDLVPFLRACATSLRHLVLDLWVAAGTIDPLLWAEHLPFRFPRLSTVGIGSPVLCCASSDFFTAFPCVTDAAVTFVSYHAAAALPLFPASLSHLAVTCTREDLLLPVVRHLHEAVESGSLPKLQSLGVRLDFANGEEGVVDWAAEQAFLGLTTLCARQRINIWSDTFTVPFWEDESVERVEVSGRVYRCIPDVPHDKLDEEYEPPSSSDSDGDSEAGADRLSESEWERQEDVPEEAWDWDAEENPLCSERWSREKRQRVAFDTAFDLFKHEFPSYEAFEAAKRAAFAATEPFLRE